MFGLIVLVCIGIYFAFSIWAVTTAANWARLNGRRSWLWGGAAALVMYNLIFWDLLPTLVADRYRCEAESGFFVYKTFDQWMKENPGVLETLSLAHLPERYRIGNHPLFRNDPVYLLPDGTEVTARFDGNGALMYVEYRKKDGESGVQLNERIRKAHLHEGPGLIKLSRDEYVLIDTKTNEVLARQVDFRTATKGHIYNQLGDSGWKAWFQSHKGCFEDHPEKFPNGGINQYVEKFDLDCINNKRGEPADRDGITISCPWRPWHP